MIVGEKGLHKKRFTDSILVRYKHSGISRWKDDWASEGHFHFFQWDLVPADRDLTLANLLAWAAVGFQTF